VVQQDVFQAALDVSGVQCLRAHGGVRVQRADDGIQQLGVEVRGHSSVCMLPAPPVNSKLVFDVGGTPEGMKNGES